MPSHPNVGGFVYGDELVYSRVESPTEGTLSLPDWYSPVSEQGFRSREAVACNTCGRREYLPTFTFRTLRSGRPAGSCLSCERETRSARRRASQGARTYGVELEFQAPLVEGHYGRSVMSDVVIAEKLRRAGLDIEAGYNHTVMNGTWKIMGDGSVPNGWEVVSPPLTWDQREDIDNACAVLKGLGCRPTMACGTHVHHDVRDLTLAAMKRLVALWRASQYITDMLVRSDRRSTQCQWAYQLEGDGLLYAVDSSTTLARLKEYDYDRYRALNLACFRRQGTVELRQRQGTLDAEEIAAWVDYGQAIIESARNDQKPNTTDGRDALLASLPMRDDQSRHVLIRTARHAANEDYADEVYADEDYADESYESGLYADEDYADEVYESGLCNCEICRRARVLTREQEREQRDYPF